jgi:hypothetical protein
VSREPNATVALRPGDRAGPAGARAPPVPMSHARARGPRPVGLRRWRSAIRSGRAAARMLSDCDN